MIATIALSAALLNQAGGNELLGRQVYLPFGTQITVNGEERKLHEPRIWTVVGQIKSGFRLVADNPATVAYLNAPFQTMLPVKNEEDGWWNDYIGEIFWLYDASYNNQLNLPADDPESMRMSRRRVRIEAAIPIAGDAPAGQGDMHSEVFHQVASGDKVIFLFSLMNVQTPEYVIGERDGYLSEDYVDYGEVGPLAGLNHQWDCPLGEIMSLGEWDAGRYFSKRSLQSDLGMSEEAFDKLYSGGPKKGMSKRELAWLIGWPTGKFSTDQAMKQDKWIYKNSVWDQVYYFERGKLARWSVKRMN